MSNNRKKQEKGLHGKITDIDQRKWCNGREYRPKLYEARVMKRKFGIDIVEIEY